MRVLIVESNEALASIWASHLRRLGCTVTHLPTQDAAMTHLIFNRPDAIVLNVVLDGGGALALADFASYRHPDVPVVFVTSTTFFSDGSIFQHAANARAFIEVGTPPADIATIVSHFGGRSRLNSPAADPTAPETAPAHATHPSREQG